MGSEGEMLPDHLDDNILSEILLRLPLQLSSLPRASAVCKRWHSVACNPGFCRRFRRHHRRNAPLLGVFHPYGFVPTLDAPNLVPPGRFSLLADHPCRKISCGSRHGLVLFIFDKGDDFRHILVWDPVTGDQYRIAIPPDFKKDARGAVLRDAGDVHFRVVLVVVLGDKQHRQALALVYSSETNSWGDLISVPLPPEAYMIFATHTPAVLVGDSLYWQLTNYSFYGILEFNLERQSLDVILAPVHRCPFSVIREEYGGLGLLSTLGFTAQFWKRKTDSDNVASWVMGRTIELDKLLSLDPDEHQGIFPLRYAEDNNYVLLNTATALFLVQLQSLQFTFIRVSGITDMLSYHPYESVFTAALSLSKGVFGNPPAPSFPSERSGAAPNTPAPRSQILEAGPKRSVISGAPISSIRGSAYARSSRKLPVNATAK